MFNAPPAAHEFTCEPVEQILMSRRRAASSKVTRGRDQPPPKMMLPDAVDHNPGRQGVPPAGDPTRQVAPALNRSRDWIVGGASLVLRLIMPQNLRIGGSNFLLGTGVISAMQDKGFRTFS